MVVLGGEAVSYERGTPVERDVAAHANSLSFPSKRFYCHAWLCVAREPERYDALAVLRERP